jgi:hypothetical protein
VTGFGIRELMYRLCVMRAKLLDFVGNETLFLLHSQRLAVLYRKVIVRVFSAF